MLHIKCLNGKDSLTIFTNKFHDTHDVSHNFHII